MDLDLWKQQMMIAMQAASIVQSCNAYSPSGMYSPTEQHMADYIDRARKISNLWLKTYNNQLQCPAR